MIELKLTSNPASESTASTIHSTFSDLTTQAAFACPVTMRVMNGSAKFVFSPSCGCVVSEAAAANIKGDRCVVCDTLVGDVGLILINPVGDELVRAKSRLEDRVVDAKNAKAMKKAAVARAKELKAIAKAALAPMAAAGPDFVIATSKRVAPQAVKKEKAAKLLKPSINMVLPDLTSALSSAATASRNVSSLYRPKDGNGKLLDDGRATYLTRGTWNRYAS